MRRFEFREQQVAGWPPQSTCGICRRMSEPGSSPLPSRVQRAGRLPPPQPTRTFHCMSTLLCLQDVPLAPCSSLAWNQVSSRSLRNNGAGVQFLSSRFARLSCRCPCGCRQACCKAWGSTIVSPVQQRDFLNIFPPCSKKVCLSKCW